MGRSRRRPPSEEEPSSDEMPPAANRAFAALLKIRHLSQQEAAEALGMEPGSVSDYVAGKKRLLLGNYRRKCAALGLKAAGEQALALVAEVDGEQRIQKAAAGDWIAAVGRLAERLAAALPARVREAVAEQDRQRFEALWKALKTLTLAEWRLVVTATPELRRWAFVKLVGDESERAASVDAKRALELARFGLWIAERVTGEEDWASQVFSWTILGNARRVGSDLAGAEEAFERSARLQAERPEGRPDLPEPWHLLDLEASLRITLRQLPEALRLLDQAAELAPRSGSIRARLLCQRSIALDRMGDPEASIAALEEALAGIEPEADPRLFCLLQSNLADTFCSAGRIAAAAEMLPALRRMQAQIGNGLNQIRRVPRQGRARGGAQGARALPPGRHRWRPPLPSSPGESRATSAGGGPDGVAFHESVMLAIGRRTALVESIRPGRPEDRASIQEEQTYKAIVISGLQQIAHNVSRLRSNKIYSRAHLI